MVEGFYYDPVQGKKVFPDVLHGKYENTIVYVNMLGGTLPLANRSHSITNEKYFSMWTALQYCMGVPDEEINWNLLAYEHGDNFARRTTMYRIGQTGNSDYIVTGYPIFVYYTEEQQEVIDEVTLMLEPYIESEVAKFVTGATELTEENFQKFVDGASVYGADELLAVYTEVYANYLASMAK